jgi:hypothetical protein
MDGAQGLTITANHCIPLQSPLVYVDKQKALVANDV